MEHCTFARHHQSSVEHPGLSLVRYLLVNNCVKMEGRRNFYIIKINISIREAFEKCPTNTKGVGVQRISIYCSNSSNSNCISPDSRCSFLRIRLDSIIKLVEQVLVWVLVWVWVFSCVCFRCSFLVFCCVCFRCSFLNNL